MDDVRRLVLEETVDVGRARDVGVDERHRLELFLAEQRPDPMLGTVRVGADDLDALVHQLPQHP